MEWYDCGLAHPEKAAQYEVPMQTPTGIKNGMVQTTISEMVIKTEQTESVESVLRKVADAWEKALK